MKCKSRLQTFNCKMAFLLAVCFITTIVISGIYKMDFSPLFVSFATAIGTIVSLVNIRYGARESILSKSNPDVIRDIIKSQVWGV